MPVASWILTLMTDTCGHIATAHWPGFSSTVNSVTSSWSPTWSVSGTVKFSTWPLSFHSLLSCMLGTCTLTATGPWGEIKEQRCNKSVWTQTELKSTREPNKPCSCAGTLPRESGCPLISSSCWQAHPHEEGVGGLVVQEQHLGVVVQEEQEQMLQKKADIWIGWWP